MSTFKLKNLSVTLGEVGQIDPAITPKLCLFPTNYCHWPTIHCHFPTKYCYWPTRHCPHHSFDPCGHLPSLVPTTIFETLTPVIKEVEDPAVLDTLKGQLDEALAAVKERGVEIDQQFRPQTREDAERLEKELEAALKEVRKMKKDLE